MTARRIAHVSDLHFGADDAAVAAALADDLRAFAPDLVVVSGDLTQRAREHEFAAARAWLAGLRCAVLAVPGNHDVPLYDVWRRAFQPLERFSRLIGQVTPTHRDSGLAVLGLNTARAGSFTSGRISRAQILALRRFFRGLRSDTLRVVVAHHQFIAPASARHHAPLGRLDHAVVALREARVDLVLAGHLHHAFADDLAAHHPACGRSIVVAQAGTAMSHRRHGRANAWNAITAAGDELAIAVRAYDGVRFTETASTRWRRGEGGWLRMAADA